MKAVTKEILGKTADGQAIESYTLSHPEGMSLSLLNWGASVTELRVADSMGRFRDVVLGLSSYRDYIENNPCYIGTAVGRTSGRICPVRVRIGGEEFSLTRNESANHIHGGIQGLHNRFWRASVPDESCPSVLLETDLADGLEGYPGNLTISFLCEWREDGALVMEYRGRTDRATLFNPTRHDYFNLAGHAAGLIGPHIVRLPLNRYLPVDEAYVENIAPRPVEGTLLDFRIPKPLGTPLQTMEAHIRGINYGFLTESVPADQPVAEIRHPESGIRLRFFTNQNVLQFYTGNFLTDTIPAKAGARYRQHCGFCLEAANFTNGINSPEWAGDCILRPGQEGVHTGIYLFDA